MAGAHCCLTGCMRHITGVLIKARIGTQAANAAAAFLNYLPFVFV
jgi:hypothetical protein